MQDPLIHLTKDNAVACQAALQRLARPRRGSKESIQLQLGQTLSIDTAGVALLWRLHMDLKSQGRSLKIATASQAVVQALSLFDIHQEARQDPDHQNSWLQALGDATWHVLSVLGLMGRLAQATLVRSPKLLLGPVSHSGLGVLGHMVQMGSRATGVVSLIAFLVGLTVALQSAAQLRQFGAGLLVADLIGVSVTRELGPLMAAILVAGRSGSAIAAELATMTITEEMDAMRVMGMDPVTELVLPRMAALSLVQPLLTMMANCIAILGGLFVAVLYLDLAPMAFVHRLQEAVTLKDLYTGLFKSVVFAWLIVLTGAASGMAARGGPDSVGKSTTQSVVAAIFAIIVADAAASLLFYFGAD